MSNIFSQMNPMVWVALVVLLAGSIVGIWVLKLVRRGAQKPGDVVKAAKEKIDQQKARKEAIKQAEATIAAPVAASRLSRISARSDEVAHEAFDDAAAALEDTPDAAEAIAEWDSEPQDAPDTDLADAFPAENEPAAWDSPEPEDAFAELDADSDTSSAGTEAETPWIASEAIREVETPAAFGQFADSDAEDAGFAAVQTPAGDDCASEPFAEAVLSDAAAPFAPAAFDLADPENHPQDWDALVAAIDVLDGALKRSWSEDHLAPSLRVRLEAAKAAAGDEIDDCLTCRSLSAQLAATELARTINSAAREQAAEIVTVVREFAHSAPFSAQDCGAVMAGLGEIQWMALIVRDGQVEKRTLPLTRHDPEAPLWVAEAQTAIAQAQRGRDAAAA